MVDKITVVQPGYTVYSYSCPSCGEAKNIVSDIPSVFYCPPKEISCPECDDTMVGTVNETIDDL